MSGQTSEKAFETSVKENLVPRGGWKPDCTKSVEYRTALITAAVTGKIDVRKSRFSV